MKIAIGSDHRGLAHKALLTARLLAAGHQVTEGGGAADGPTDYPVPALAVGASLAVVLGKNPIHSVLLLIVSFAALAGLYIGLDAPFAAVVQIIIYAGAIMVLFLFVVMLLNAHREDDPAAME